MTNIILFVLCILTILPLNMAYKVSMSSMSSISTEFLSPFRCKIDDWTNWSLASRFWKSIMNTPPDRLPSYIKGDKLYGLSDMKAANEACQRGEMRSKNSYFDHKKTYAITFGYDGTKFNGYQSQRNNDSTWAVEDSLKRAFKGHHLTVAGRTDRGVNAISQIVSFVSSIDNIDLLAMKNFSVDPSVINGDISIYNICRVPRKFNARATATWRRYLYIVPLNRPYDVDIHFTSDVLLKLQGKVLPYNAFAYNEDRTTGEGLQDLCTLYRCHTYLTDLSDPLYEAHDIHTTPVSAHILDTLTTPALCIELVGTRFLRQMVRRLVSTAIREALITNADKRNVNILPELCHAGDRYLRAYTYILLLLHIY